MPEPPDSRKLFEQAVESHAESMYRVAWRLTGNANAADDLVQETFSQAWQKIDSLKDATKIRSWMFAILRNQNLKAIRRKNPAASPDVDLVTDHRSGEADNADRADRIDLVQQAVEQLEEDQRMPILLVSMEGLSVEEAAEILGIPRGTVLSRMHRGRKRLKEIIQKEVA